MGKVALVLGRVPSCKDFLEALAEAAISRVGNMPQAQLLLLTQGLAPLGGENAHFTKVLDTWAAGSGDETKGKLSSDQLAKLAQTLAPLAPSHSGFWNGLGT